MLRVALLAALVLLSQVGEVQLRSLCRVERGVREDQLFEATSDPLQMEDQAVARVVVRPTASTDAADRVELGQSGRAVGHSLVTAEGADVAEEGPTVVADEGFGDFDCRWRRLRDQVQCPPPRGATESVDALLGRDVPGPRGEAPCLVRVRTDPANPIGRAPLAAVRVWWGALAWVDGQWVDGVVREPA